jgi:hypothetical protein
MEDILGERIPENTGASRVTSVSLLSSICLLAKALDCHIYSPVGTWFCCCVLAAHESILQDGKRFYRTDLFVPLRDGQILCRLMLLLQKGSIPKASLPSCWCYLLVLFSKLLGDSFLV